MTSALNTQALDSLPSTFTYSDARALLNERRLRDLVAEGLIVRLHRGLYRKTGADGDEDLIEIAARRPMATLCLRSALARHDLIDDIPTEIDIALPRGAKPTIATAVPVAWHFFDAPTFEIGRELLQLETVTEIGLYSAERSIVDSYRLRHQEGAEMANQALRRWLKNGGQPARLMRLSRNFPKATPALRNALEILL
jgi:predicted transcriptional regulator of viral defense system